MLGQLGDTAEFLGDSASSCCTDPDLRRYNWLNLGPDPTRFRVESSHVAGAPSCDV